MKVETMRWIFACLLLRWPPADVEAAVACASTYECERKLRPGSRCREGHCDNPFQRGCLRTVLGDDFRERICNSDDEDGAEEHGLCRKSPLDYMEISISPANWDSSIFLAWIMQIVLSELADVPVSLDTGVGGGKLNFYDAQNSFDYPKDSYHDFEGLYKANEVKDCRTVKTANQTCAHVLPEVWPVRQYMDEDQVERDGNGMVGQLGWYVSTDVVRKHPSLASHWGLRSNRTLLAELFKRPTTWKVECFCIAQTTFKRVMSSYRRPCLISSTLIKDYCDQVSTNGCLTDDGIAAKPPEPDKNNSYFVEGLYKGHFRATDRNNCAINNNTCTGHFIDYPCFWSAYTDSQLYWQNIPLEKEGDYSYSDMLQIMMASNATGSPAIFMWWYPDGNAEKFADLFVIELMRTTSECLENRPEPVPHRCNKTRHELIGSREGSCGYTAHRLEKMYANSLLDTLKEPEAIRSPAYQTIRNIRVNDIEITEMMLKWLQRGIDTYGYDPRDVVCEWAADHVGNEDFLIDLLRFIPKGYPRKIQYKSFHEPYLYAAMAFATLSILLIIMTAVALYHYRHHG
ncbi:hypothetical protein ACHAWF_006130 [Thalassiosira exigua]